MIDYMNYIFVADVDRYNGFIPKKSFIAKANRTQFHHDWEKSVRRKRKVKKINKKHKNKK